MRHPQLLPPLVALAALAGGPPLQAEDLSPATFEPIHRLIRPGPGESRWREAPWGTSIWDARRRAAAEGKPILIWSGGGAAPLGGC
jgi:hypothetical protein